MNRIHRVVWSECRKAFIVAGEHAKAKGKPSSSTRKAVASAVVMALAAMAAEPALAGNGQTWTAGAYTNSSSNTGSTFGVFAGSSGTLGNYINNSTISGTLDGMALTGSTLSGGITNSGTISGIAHTGIHTTKHHCNG